MDSTKAVPKYDSTGDTIEHIRTVKSFLGRVISCLEHRGLHHDASKFGSPEKEGFDEWTPKLAGSTYGSKEYAGMLESLKPALDHHYQHNRHHPEYHGDAGVRGMSLIDLIEMVCDWKADTMRHDDGDIRRSLVINTKRFNIDPAVAQLLENTINAMGW